MSTTAVKENEVRLPSSGLPDNLKVTQWRVIRSEWLKFWSLRSSYFALGAAIIGMIGLGAMITAVTANRWSELVARHRDFGFDPAGSSLQGFELAQLVVGVLGVLVVSGEYGTGMIRSSMAAAPKRLPVIWGKAVVMGVIAFLVCTITAFIAFFLGQSLLSSAGIQTTLGAPGVLRVVLGTGLYLTVVALFAGALAWIIRSTAGAIAGVFGILLVLPLISKALPADWAQHVVPYLPSNAGQEVLTLTPDPGMLAPWTGFAVFCAYLVVGFVLAVVLVKRRDT